MVKGFGYEIARALGTRPKSVAWKLKFEWSQAFKCSIKKTRLRSQPNGFALPTYSCGPFVYIIIYINLRVEFF